MENWPKWYLAENGAELAPTTPLSISVWAFTMFLWNLTLGDMHQAVIWHRLALNPEKLELERIP